MVKATKLPSGSWRARVQITDDSGHRVWRSFTAPTKKEAEFLASQYEFTEKAPSSVSYTVGSASDAYIASRSAVLSPATLRGYTAIRTNQISSIASIPVSSIRSTDIQRFINQVAMSHSPKTVRNVYTFLTAVLRCYRPDFAPRVNLPQRIHHEIEIPTKDQVLALVAAAHGTPLESAILLASGYGLRRGEICALTSADLSGTLLTINKSMSRTPHGSADTWVIKSPKSFAGFRTLSVSPILVEALLRNQSGARFVPYTPDDLTRRFEALCASLGIRYRFHDLRHFNASMMLALSVPDKYAMQRLGQSTPGLIKTVYQHLMSDKQQEVTDTMNAAFDAFSANCDTKCDTPL